MLSAGKYCIPLALGISQELYLDINDLKTAFTKTIKKFLRCKCPEEEKVRSRVFLKMLSHFLKIVKVRTGVLCRKPRMALRPVIRRLDRVIDKFEELRNPLCFHSLKEVERRNINNILDVCNIRRPLPYQFVLKPDLQDFHKITEGAYGEIYVFKSTEGRDSILKIMTVYGGHRDEPEAKFQPEFSLNDAVSSKKLSTLKTPGMFHAPNFPKAYTIQLAKGKPPNHLSDAWLRYLNDPTKEDSAFLRPDRYTKGSLFLIMELENCGGHFLGHDYLKGMQAVSMVLQTASALAVAESAFEFEHRDLHVGNWLCKSTTENYITYTTPELHWRVPTFKIMAYIIDFTMSRIKKGQEIVSFDLRDIKTSSKASSTSERPAPLFMSLDDVYSMMREAYQRLQRFFSQEQLMVDDPSVFQHTFQVQIPVPREGDEPGGQVVYGYSGRIEKRHDEMFQLHGVSTVELL